MKRVFWLLSFVALAACSSGAPRVSDFDFYYENVENLSGTVSALENFPAENAVDVDPAAEIEIQFSGPLKESTIDQFTVRVEDQFGFVVPGQRLISNDKTTIRFVPQQDGQRFALAPGRTYLVKTRFLENAEGLLIGDYNWKFRTAGDIGSSEDFRIVEILPQESMVMPFSSVAVRFSQQIQPPSDTTTLCSQVQWAESFQVLRLSFLDGSDQFTLAPLGGEACIQADENGDFTILQFFPLVNGQPAGLPAGSYIRVVVKPSDGLRSLETGAQLSNSSEIQLFVFPNPQDVVDLIF